MKENRNKKTKVGKKPKKVDGWTCFFPIRSAQPPKAPQDSSYPNSGLAIPPLSGQRAIHPMPSSGLCYIQSIQYLAISEAEWWLTENPWVENSRWNLEEFEGSLIGASEIVQSVNLRLSAPASGCTHRPIFPVRQSDG